MPFYLSIVRTSRILPGVNNIKTGALGRYLRINIEALYYLEC